MVLQGTTGTIIRLIRYSAKDDPGLAVQSVCFLEEQGMEGDFYARGGDRQLSLLSLEDRQWIDTMTEPGLCLKRYKENILFDGIPSTAFKPGIRLEIGKAVIQISDCSKNCFTECPLYSCGQKCVLAGKYLYAKVIHSGPVKMGDIIKEEI